MEASIAVSLLMLISLVVGFILYISRVRIIEPNVGIVYRFGGKIIRRRLTPGLHFYIRNAFGLQIHQIVVVPGRLIKINIHPDRASTRNVRVQLDIEIFVQLKLASDGFPTFKAARNLLNWIHVSGYETLFGQETEDGYETGAIDRVLQAFLQGKVSEVITQYEPESITAHPDVFEKLRLEILSEVYPFIESWAGTLYVKVQEISVPDEESREKQIRDARAAAQSEKAIQLTQIDILEEYRKRLGDKYATIYASTKALEGAQVNLFGSGLTDAVGTLFANKLKQKQAQRSRRKRGGSSPWETL